MCGIIFRYGPKPGKYTSVFLEARDSLDHRGPDRKGFYRHGNSLLGFTRLSIVDQSATQPIINREYATMTNGEFYNQFECESEDQYEERSFIKKFEYKTKCDSEIAIPLYLLYGPDFFKHLHGKFATVLVPLGKQNSHVFMIGRDRMGICPLYWGRDSDGGIWFASEMKALVKANVEPNIFPTGYYYLASKYYKKDGTYTVIQSWFEYHDYSIPKKNFRNGSFSHLTLRNALIHAIKIRIPEVKMGCLLSGGLDSSIVASVLSKYVEGLKTFSIGFADSPDLLAAKKVAEYIKSDHYEFIINKEEAFDAIPQVIYYLETFDITTIRAATPMYLMAKKIRELNIKVVFSGEGADELFGGYAYFKFAPNPAELQQEIYRKMRLLHRYDCLRANKALMAHGIEGRFPFLDQHFVEYGLSINPALKMSNRDIEKKILRKAFEGFLPDDILWRKKEQFSDGVGHSWISYLKEKTKDTKLIEDQIDGAWNPEGQYYRNIFDLFYPNRACVKTVLNVKSLACSTPKIKHWYEDFDKKADPSGLI